MTDVCHQPLATTIGLALVILLTVGSVVPGPPPDAKAMVFHGLLYQLCFRSPTPATGCAWLFLADFDCSIHTRASRELVSHQSSSSQLGTSTSQLLPQFPNTSCDTQSGSAFPTELWLMESQHGAPGELQNNMREFLPSRDFQLNGKARHFHIAS